MHVKVSCIRRPIPCNRVRTRVIVAAAALRCGAPGRSVVGCNSELVEEAVEPLLMRKGEALKFDANAVPAGPADRGPLNQEGDLLSRDVQQEIHFHAGEDKGVALEPAAFAREIH